VEIKSFPKPPPLVQMTLEAVCILKQEKPDWDTVSPLGPAGGLPRIGSIDDEPADAEVSRTHAQAGCGQLLHTTRLGAGRLLTIGFPFKAAAATLAAVQINCYIQPWDFPGQAYPG
jgi:hypothetical protein